MMILSKSYQTNANHFQIITTCYFKKMKTFSEIHLLDCPLDRRMDVSDILGSYNVNFEDSATFDFDTVSRANFDNVDGFLVDREYCK